MKMDPEAGRRLIPPTVGEGHVFTFNCEVSPDGDLSAIQSREIRNDCSYGQRFAGQRGSAHS